MQGREQDGGARCTCVRLTLTSDETTGRAPDAKKGEPLFLQRRAEIAGGDRCIKPGSARKATVDCTRFDCRGRPSKAHLFGGGAAASFLSALFQGGRLGIESYQFVGFGGGSLKGSSKLLSCSDESSITPDPSSSSVEMAAAI